MLRFFSTIIGENPEYVSRFSPAGKRKVMLYANAILVPVALWFVNGFLMISEILGGSLLVATITGLFTAGLIFIIERCIILSNGSTVIMISRIFLGFLIALLGAICLDEVIFKNDINLKLAEYKSHAIDKGGRMSSSEFDGRIDELSSIVGKKRADWKEAQINAAGECDGTSGSRIARRGPICEMKMAIANDLKEDYDRAVLDLKDLQQSRDSAMVLARTSAEAGFNDKGLLIRMRALYDLIQNDPIIRGVYILFTLMIFCLEFLVVMIKVFSKDSPDEFLEYTRNQAMKTRVGALLERTDQYRSNQEIMARVQSTQEMLKNDHARLLS